MTSTAQAKPVETLAQELDDVQAHIEQALRRSATEDQFATLGRLHLAEAALWKHYADLSSDRLRSKAALRAADRSTRLAAQYGAYPHVVTAPSTSPARRTPVAIPSPFEQVAA